ncbi:MAG: hypothetical protein EOP04_10010 [Proteobacteria bacterium]|nr:MAG: hypothetical protein EOP04_10010 [Pseudomonadota bacterium]
MNRTIKAKINKEEPFEVGESRGLLYALALLFFIMFVTSFVEVVDERLSLQMRFDMLKLTIFPSIGFFLKGYLNRISLRIDSEGIYYYGRLMTDWDHFISARVEQILDAGDIGDNFVLYLKYTKSEGGVYRKSIPLSNTQNKAEEEVIAAIKCFSSCSKESRQSY